MQIYDKPVRALMKDMAEELAPTPETVFTRRQALDWFQQHYPKIKPGTVTAHLLRLSTNAPSRVYYGSGGEVDVLYQVDAGRYRLYNPAVDPSPIRKPTASDTAGVPDGEDEDTDEYSGSSEFAYEKDLKNYLARNLPALESGLSLYEDEGISGIEFPVGGRYIDLLATDAQGGLVVIELKVSRGYERVIGQLMRYVAWIQTNLAEEGQSVRGIIVASTISHDLRLACSLVPQVALYEYELSLELKAVPNL